MVKKSIGIIALSFLSCFLQAADRHKKFTCDQAACTFKSKLKGNLEQHLFMLHNVFEKDKKSGFHCSYNECGFKALFFAKYKKHTLAHKEAVENRLPMPMRHSKKRVLSLDLNPHEQLQWDMLGMLEELSDQDKKE